MLRFSLFYHSLVSDWNHGNAHFLRGVAAELGARGHQVDIYEPEDSWSRENLLADQGEAAIDGFHDAFPQLRSTRYTLAKLDLSRILAASDVAIVHEWSDPAVVSAVNRYRKNHSGLRTFFHDTHHRAVSSPEDLARFELDAYDGVLAYGASLKEAYERLGWGKRVHIWHEAADTRLFYPRSGYSRTGDLVWVGNWGDDERTAELSEFLIEPIRDLHLQASIYGVRYPAQAVEALTKADISYQGWLPNFAVPEVFARHRATVHGPRRPYTRQLPGIPTIRPFEALACGIPLVSAPWSDEEGLFRVGEDFLMVRNGEEMKARLREVVEDDDLAASLAASGLETIRKRHTCGHRVDELLAIYESMRPVMQAAEALS